MPLNYSCLDTQYTSWLNCTQLGIFFFGFDVHRMVHSKNFQWTKRPMTKHPLKNIPQTIGPKEQNVLHPIDKHSYGQNVP